MRIRNPIAFRPRPVTTICTVVYLALVIPLLIINHVVPSPLSEDEGHLREAWRDLQILTSSFHPYNSHKNDRVREWLLKRINNLASDALASDRSKGQEVPVVVFSDTASNLSFSSNGSSPSIPGISVYFEGTNIIVYIRGSEDDSRDWWLTGDRPDGNGGVLVNAHYDSVSTGYGATDDGIGVVTVLQLIKYFAVHQPRKGIVALLNNGEEDYLNGARAFSQHPISRFPHTFLNLEGAGAGGRATLFRSTDAEVTRFYGASRMPFGNVLSADAFKRGVIRSETDYSFFNGALGMRGLDVAFFAPRSRYHTEEDDTKHASKASLNHMMSSSFATIKCLTSDTSSEFQKSDDSGKEFPYGRGSSAVWFDLFGHSFAVFKLNTLFAISVTLLVVGPITLIAILVLLHRSDKLYILTYSKRSRWSENSDSVGVKGLRGLTRWPIAFILSSAAVVGLAFLMRTVNPYIAYSSPYAVWTMMISAWLVVACFCVTVADYLRPSALQRVYTLLWMFLAAWVVLVFATMAERQQKLASGYLFVFNFACIYVATVAALLESFGLPRKADYADDHAGPHSTQHNVEAESVVSPRPLEPNEEQHTEGQGEEPDETDPIADENTALLSSNRSTFKRYSSPHQRVEESHNAEPPPEEGPRKQQAYGFEQTWSAALPSSLWVLEFLLVTVIPLILIGQVCLLFTFATYQTLADGSPPLLIYLAIAILTVLVLAPLAPFLHRITFEIPAFLFLIFLGTLLYNIFAFPFSPANRLKLYFIQRVDLDTGHNNVSLIGIREKPFLTNTITNLPSSSGQEINCMPSTTRADLEECSWSGLAPNVIGDSSLPYTDWLSFNVTRHPSNHTIHNHLLSRSSKPDNRREYAHFSISGHDTRACKILFSQPIRDFYVHGSGGSHQDPRFPRVVSGAGSKELRLWSRTWGRTWEVDVWWDGNASASSTLHSDKGPSSTKFDGKVVCLWSDANQIGVIPALDEVKHFAPAWVTVTKAADGLVEGSKDFVV